MKDFMRIIFLILPLIILYNHAIGLENGSASHNESYSVLWIGILMVGAVFSLIANKFRQSAILGQILVGLAISILANYNIGFFNEFKSSPDIKLIAELGSIFLLFEIGLESDFNEIKNCSKSAFNAAILGVIVPFFLGYFVVAPFILKTDNYAVAFFIGSMLAVTSTSISVSVFKELNIIKWRACQIVLAASVIDDIAGLILLSLVTAIAITGQADWLSLIHTITSVATFLLISLALGKIILPKIVIPNLRFIATGNTITVLTIVGICFVLSWLANYYGLDIIIGAFFAGLMLNSKTFIKNGILAENVEENNQYNSQLVNLISSFSKVLTPIFFIYAGIKVDIVNALNLQTIIIAILISLAAILGKAVCGIFLPRDINKLIVGFGMVPRGEIGIIFAITGLNLKIIDNNTFAALLLMVIITSMITPIALNKIINRNRIKQ